MAKAFDRHSGVLAVLVVLSLFNQSPVHPYLLVDLVLA